MLSEDHGNICIIHDKVTVITRTWGGDNRYDKEYDYVYGDLCDMK